MDLNYSAEEIAFRDDVRAYLAANLPADLQHKVLNHKRLSKDDFVRWHKILAKQGWVATGWPEEYGGTGWTPTQRHIFEEECATAGTPRIMPFGVMMVAPVIMAFGNQAQKDYYLPRILNCDDWWCPAGATILLGPACCNPALFSQNLVPAHKVIFGQTFVIEYLVL